jgi:predicted cupin superfamily sugar epimerase
VTVPRTAAEWIRALGLVPHPEGGHYRETYRSAETVPGRGGAGPRAASTAIYFLLQAHELSALHRLRSDELWHFHTGAPLRVSELTPEGGLREHRLGLDVEVGEQPQAAIAAGSWFGARVAADIGFSLVSCTVAPGFDFADFELGTRAALQAQYGRYAATIDALTRG